MNTDRRVLKSNGRVAHSSLRGTVEAAHFTDGERWQVVADRVAVMDADGVKREREMILGQGFQELEVRDRMAFGFCEHNGYVGYVDTLGLARNMPAPTHKVAALMSYSKAAPDLKARNEVSLLSHGALVTVLGQQDDWSEIVTFAGDEGGPASIWVPSQHLEPIAQLKDDPVAVAEMFVGTPYLWGGNSVFGLDCSGLVQAALHSCGYTCPGDSDLQEAALGVTLPKEVPLRRGDLLFWPGHVGIVADERTFLHANAHHMAVAYEPLDAVFARIGRHGADSVRRRARLDPAQKGTQ
ncbi:MULTISPECIES: NlpC/P60 family protein [unclassified Marinovum]